MVGDGVGGNDCVGDGGVDGGDDVNIVLGVEV